MTSVARTRQIHLNRAARNAGEAFAFDEPDTAPIAHRSPWTSVLWGIIAVAAFTGLYFIV